MLMNIFKKIKKNKEISSKKNFKINNNLKLNLSVQKTKLPKVLLLGTCQAERIYEAGNKLDWSVQHELCDFNPHTQININKNFDLLILNPTLRSILAFADKNGNGDILTVQIEQDYNNFEHKSIASLREAISRYLEAYNSILPIIVISFIEPPPSAHGFTARNRTASLYTLVRKLNDELEKLCHEYMNVHYLEINDIRLLFGDRVAYDGYEINYTHASYYAGKSRTNYLNNILFQKIEILWRIINNIDPIKLIITDLDNTLWQGTIAEEENIEGWKHTEGWPLGYVEALLECKRRGILLAICSKNNEEETLENFRKIWCTRLLVEDFCSIKINWKSKAINIQKILDETNILSENVLFIDDNPLEIAEIKNFFPNIRTLTIPQEQWRRILLFSPETQIGAASQEAYHKTNLIRAKIVRDEAAQTLSRNDFLNSLSLELYLDKIIDSKHPAFERMFELLNKTNQFNSTGKRWSYMEINDFLEKGGFILIGKAKDRFADHGIISLILFKNQILEQFILSCRVFGLGIEQALLASLMNTNKIAETKIISKETGKNYSFITFKKSLPLNNDILTLELAPSIPSWIKVL